MSPLELLIQVFFVIMYVNLSPHYFCTEFSSVTVTTEEQEETYSSALQIPEKSKTLELKPEQKMYSSSIEKKKEKPIFITQLAPVAATAGDTARLTVTISAFPKPKVQWFHNGRIITSSSVYTFIENKDVYTLIISGVKKEYEGEYSCVATNKFGKTTCTTTLNVNVSDATEAERWVEQMFKIPGQPPRFVTPIESVQSAEGGEAKFQFKVSGAPLPEVQWFKGSFQIQPSKRITIVYNPDGLGFMSMTGLHQQDSGLYTCRASNSFGEASSSAELIVFRETVSVSRHKEKAVTQKQKGYKVSTTEQATESRLYMVNIPGETREQAGREMIYTIGTEDRQVVASEQVDTLREVDISAATIHREQVTHQAAVLQSHELQERVSMGPPRPQPVVATPVKQIHTASLTSAVEENQGFIEQHSERIKSPEITELEMARERPSKMMSAISENITPFTIVKAGPLAKREEEKTESTREPKHPLSSHQVETTLSIMKEDSQTIPAPQVEKSYKVKEGVKILYSAISTEKQEITEGHSTELATSDSAIQSSVKKEKSKPVILSVSETKHTLSKEERFTISRPEEEVAYSAKDSVFKTALSAEEKRELQAERMGELPGLDSAVSVHSEREGEQILHLQVISDQGILPSEGRFTCEKPSEEQADVRKSPTLLHSISTDEQRTVTCEDSAHFSSEKTTMTLQPQKEPFGTLHLQSIQSESALTKEGMISFEKPDQQVAAQRQEKARRHAVTTEEKREMTADYYETLDTSVTGLQPEHKKEPKPQSILQVISEPMQLPKETPFSTDMKQQRALVQKEDRWNIVHVTSVSDRQDLEEGHTDDLGSVEKFTCKTDVEPKLPSESISVEERAVSTESSVALEAAEQDFAVQIQEGQSVRQSIIMDEKRILTGEQSKQISKSETTTASVVKQSKSAFMVSESSESQTLPKELTFVIQAPKSFTLDVRRQLKSSLQSAVARDQPLILADVVQSLAVVEVQEVKVLREPKYAKYTYLITTTGAPIEITIAFEGDYPQTADLKSELQAAFYSIVYREQHVLTSEQPGTMQVDRPQRLQVTKASSKEILSPMVQTVQTSENVSDIASPKAQSAAIKTETKASFQTVTTQGQTIVQESKRTMVQMTTESKLEIEKSIEISSQESRSVTISGRERDVGAAAITIDVPFAPVPVEQSVDIHIKHEKTQEFLTEETIKTTKITEKVGKYAPIFETELEDITVEEKGKVTFTVSVKFVKNVNWMFNGKLIKSGKEFKCSKQNNTYTLVIDKVIKEKHEGEYVCEAENEGGKTSTSSTLTVVSRGWTMRTLLPYHAQLTLHSFILPIHKKCKKKKKCNTIL